jgi:hypothetical protein
MFHNLPVRIDNVGRQLDDGFRVMSAGFYFGGVGWLFFHAQRAYLVSRIRFLFCTQCSALALFLVMTWAGWRLTRSQRVGV